MAEHNTLWRRVVETNKYVSMFFGGVGCCYNSVHSLDGICLWKNIRKGWKLLSVLLVLNFGMILGVWGYLCKRVTLKFLV